MLMSLREKAEEYRADLYKLLGLALATPFSVIFSSMLIDNQYLNSGFSFFSFCISLILVIPAILCFNYAYGILEDLDKREGRD